MIAGPLFVGKHYLLDREIVAISESRRTESYWVKTQIRDAETDAVVATTLLNHATMKNSFSGYDAERGEDS